jgi:hypothetical protein
MASIESGDIVSNISAKRNKRRILEVAVNPSKYLIRDSAFTFMVPPLTIYLSLNLGCKNHDTSFALLNSMHEMSRSLTKRRKRDEPDDGDFDNDAHAEEALRLEQWSVFT